MNLRDATPDDLPAVLALNEASVAVLSPLTPARLADLHDQAAHHRVIVDGGTVRAFLLAFREGAAYDSPNYAWFAHRHPRYLYIDRVVVDAADRTRGLGTRLYRDLLAAAVRDGVPVVACEYDLEPPNPVSARFHESFGFREVGRQRVGDRAKLVSLQELPIATAADQG